MSEKRMAGEKLDEPTQESADAKEALSRSQRNKQIREEIGNDPERLEQRISGVDREKYDFTGFTDKEINMAMQGESFGDKDYARLTGATGVDKPKPGDEDTVVTIPETPEEPGGSIDPVYETPGRNPFIPAPITGGPGQTVVQDNDITSNVTGDNNNVNNNQDNSVNGYGGRKSSWKDAWMKDYFA